MLSLSPPITLITCPPKTTTNPTHASRSQSRRLPSQPMIIIKRGTTVAGSIPNADKAEGRASIDEDLLEVELTQTELRKEMIPKHVAVIMDGNGRWAKMRGLPLSEGHTAGMQSLKTMVKMCLRWEIKLEVEFLFSLLERIINSETEAIMREQIKISMIGDSSKLPKSLQRMISSVEESTKNHSKLQLIAAINYGGKYDVVQACKSVAKKVQDGSLHLEDIDENIIEKELETKCTEFPNPDLLIRTSGELRVSNFMLWQLAYAELFFNQKLWPDFGKDEFVEALSFFQKRQRRYGGRH
ncbi:dehydrodolichyl diphosphate synthase 2 isoform X2 [Medicago truncatula]|uniref:dehydrodolichyl diphosphate synthase 2 isoform X2 n=1 Tax=Medicago truncatula TaxID=3880 RepID=UPI00196813B9|nr:dehydrodolichyl diphosphate synthase 2 isoform X2 [Medicago truncatula]